MITPLIGVLPIHLKGNRYINLLNQNPQVNLQVNEIAGTNSIQEVDNKFGKIKGI